MRTVKVALSHGRGYPIFLGVPLSGLGRYLRTLDLSSRMVLVADRRVAALYGNAVMKGLRANGFETRLSVVNPGESTKNLETARRLYRECIAAGLDRKSAIVALGGGVVGDLAGFVAATFMRGIPFVQCPTTLLAMVDSSIGGKVGVDLPEGKNLVGAFWQPKVVWADFSVLKTLPAKEWRNGIAEIVKYGMIEDASILDVLEKSDFRSLSRQPGVLASLVARSAAIKARVVGEDEREAIGRREILNLGHTFGHAIESVTGYRAYSHGEAVAVGLCAAARLSVKLGYFDVADVHRIENILEKWGLPVRTRVALPRKSVLAAMARDKKNLDGRFRFVIPVRRGRVSVFHNVSNPAIEKCLDESGL